MQTRTLGRLIMCGLGWSNKATNKHQSTGGITHILLTQLFREADQTNPTEQLAQSVALVHRSQFEMLVEHGVHGPPLPPHAPALHTVHDVLLAQVLHVGGHPVRKSM